MPDLTAESWLRPSVRSVRSALCDQVTHRAFRSRASPVPELVGDTGRRTKGCFEAAGDRLGFMNSAFAAAAMVSHLLDELAVCHAQIMCAAPDRAI
jgi:hypothetical protein